MTKIFNLERDKQKNGQTNGRMEDRTDSQNGKYNTSRHFQTHYSNCLSKFLDCVIFFHFESLSQYGFAWRITHEFQKMLMHVMLHTLSFDDIPQNYMKLITGVTTFICNKTDTRSRLLFFSSDMCSVGYGLFCWDIYMNYFLPLIKTINCMLSQGILCQYALSIGKASVLCIDVLNIRMKILS